jgi:hypothetical protein
MTINAVLGRNLGNLIVKHLSRAFFCVYSDFITRFAYGGAVFLDNCHGIGWLVFS